MQAALFLYGRIGIWVQDGEKIPPNLAFPGPITAE